MVEHLNVVFLLFLFFLFFFSLPFLFCFLLFAILRFLPLLFVFWLIIPFLFFFPIFPYFFFFCLMGADDGRDGGRVPPPIQNSERETPRNRDFYQYFFKNSPKILDFSRFSKQSGQNSRRNQNLGVGGLDGPESAPPPGQNFVAAPLFVFVFLLLFSVFSFFLFFLIFIFRFSFSAFFFLVFLF